MATRSRGGGGRATTPAGAGRKRGAAPRDLCGAKRAKATQMAAAEVGGPGAAAAAGPATGDIARAIEQLEERRELLRLRRLLRDGECPDLMRGEVALDPAAAELRRQWAQVRVTQIGSRRIDRAAAAGRGAEVRQVQQELQSDLEFERWRLEVKDKHGGACVRELERLSRRSKLVCPVGDAAYKARMAAGIAAYEAKAARRARQVQRHGDSADSDSAGSDGAAGDGTDSDGADSDSAGGDSADGDSADSDADVSPGAESDSEDSPHEGDGAW